MRKYFTAPIIIGFLIGAALGVAVDLVSGQFPMWVFIGAAIGGTPGTYRASQKTGGPTG